MPFNTFPPSGTLESYSSGLISDVLGFSEIKGWQPRAGELGEKPNFFQELLLETAPVSSTNAHTRAHMQLF